MLSGLKAALIALLRGSKAERELDEELRYHLERQIDLNLRLGMTPEEARLAARTAFGGVEQAKERSRDARGARWLGELWRDLRFGARMLVKAPGFTAIAVVTLAAGIGGNTAMFSLVNGVLLRQLPFRRPEQLVWVSSRRTDPGKHPFTLPDFIDYRDQNRSLSGIAAFANWSANLTDQGDPERLQGLRISANAFQTLGAEAALGRAFRPEDDEPGRQHVTVLSYELWRRRFGADPRIVGEKLILNGDGYTVVGVLPRQFFFPVREAELAIPLAPDADPWRGARGSVNFLRAVARLKPGVTREQAEADLTAVAQRLRRQYPVANAQKIGVTLSPLHEEVVANFRLSLWILFGSVVVALLIACVNLANLALTRAAARRKEMAVRAALGATRRRLIQQLAIESLLLAALGGGTGLLLAYYGIDLLLAFGPENLPRAREVGVDGRVLGFTAGLALLAGGIFGLLPAWQATRVDLNEELKEGGRGSAGGARQNRARKILVVSEIALSLTLLVAAGLLLKSFSRLQAVNPGFDPKNVLAIRLSLPRAQYANLAAVSAFYDKLRPRLESLPGVESVGVATAPPFSGVLQSIPFTIEGRGASPEEAQRADYRIVGADYFRVLKIPLISGREFNDRDTARTKPVALISQSLAGRYWPNGNPVGARLRIDDNDQGPRTVEIVGVIGDVRHLSLDGDPAPHIYLPVYQTHEDAVVWLTNNQYWLLRATVDPLTLAAAARREIRGVDPDAPTSSVRALEQYLDDSVAPRRFNLRLLAIFAGVALALASAGLSGVISHEVAQRRREIGVRMAFGARSSHVLKLVIGDGLTLAAAGVAIGLAAALALTRLMKSLLFDVSATDPMTFFAIALLLMFVAVLACYLPARRAAKVDPMTALRRD